MNRISIIEIKEKLLNTYRKVEEKAVDSYIEIANSETAKKMKNKFEDTKHEAFVKYMKKKYPDYIDDEYNFGRLKFIFGIPSQLQTEQGETPNIYTTNDACLYFDRATKQYNFDVETDYFFEDNYKAAEHFKRILSEFSNFMDDNGLNKKYEANVFHRFLANTFIGDSIEEVYAAYKIFALGFYEAYHAEYRPTDIKDMINGFCTKNNFRMKSLKEMDNCWVFDCVDEGNKINILDKRFIIDKRTGVIRNGSSSIKDVFKHQ